MIAVIILSGPFPGMHGLDAECSPALLPLGDRPTLQHIVESLVTQGITRIEIIAGHGPERVENLLGNGDRWGCSFRYHLAAQHDCPYRSLKVISGLNSEPWILIHAERFPCVEFSPRSTEMAALYYGSFLPVTGSAPPESSWGGTVVMPPMEITDEFANFTPEALSVYLEDRLQTNSAAAITTEEWIDVSSPGRILDSQSRLLDKKLHGLLLSGAERQSGIWIARNATIHPSVRLTAPLYVGANTRLSKGVRVGPYAVIGPDCIVDSNTMIDNSLIFKDSYVGEGLEVHKSIVAHNLLVNVRLDASVDISEDFLLGRLERPQPTRLPIKIIQSSIALGMILVLLPVILLAWLYYALFQKISFTTMNAVCLPAEEKSTGYETFALPAIGADAWTIDRPAGWTAFTRQFLPGLFAVACCRLSLVGLPPRNPQQVASLNEDWRKIYLEGRAGLITEVAVASQEGGDEMHRYLADAYYLVKRGLVYNFRLAIKYFIRLIVPASKSK
jgi:NDP-sugar pyrophosphorylase family protein